MKETEFLADFITKTSWEDVPEEVFQRSKWAILDCFASAFAGLQHEVGKGIISFVQDMGGKPTSTVWGDGHRTSAPWAAYANATLSHAIDYDDVNENMKGHPTAPVLPALLAIGEKVGASGQEVLLSYVLGVEIEAKIGLALGDVHFNLGWHPTATLGNLAAAVACGKVIKLNREQMLMALGIAGSQASGLKQNFGTMTKPLHVGQAAKNGVLSALLASRGWTADREILEGHFGFCNLFAGRGVYNLKNTTENLGKPFDFIQPGIQFKKYPCCTRLFPSLDAMAKVLKEHPFRPKEVESIECRVGPDLIHCLVHPKPQNGLEGKFSLEYVVAAMIIDGRVAIEQFTDERVKDKRIKSFLPKIKTIQESNRKAYTVSLKIKLSDGRTLEQEGDFSPGITNWEELVAKYRDCLGGALPTEQIQQSLQMIRHMEKIKDISEVVKVLVPGIPIRNRDDLEKKTRSFMKTLVRRPVHVRNYFSHTKVAYVCCIKLTCLTGRVIPHVMVPEIPKEDLRTGRG